MKNRIGKLFSRKISINFVSNSILPSFSLNFSFGMFVAFLSLFLILMLRTAISIMSDVDYYITKADNKILKIRLNYLMAKARESFDYLEMSKKTENQIKKIIGMDKNFYDMAYDNNVGGPDIRNIKNFKIMLDKKAKEINEKQVNNIFDAIKKESRERITGYEEITWYITNKYYLSRALPKGWPTIGEITSPFGYRIHPLTFSYEYHSGIDISNIPGTKIMATADGVVRYTGWASGYGLSVVIDHGFGYSTLYGHMSEIKVEEGMNIKRGEEIGRMGSTGTSTGPHLHYEVWENNVPKNPVKYLDYSKNSSLLTNLETMFKVN